MSPKDTARAWNPEPAEGGAIDTAALQPATLLLGMPHLGPRGLCENWLLRVAGHRHWMAVADRVGVPIDAIRDVTGDRVFASIVGCTVEGRLDGFAENDAIRIETVLAPTPQNDWRSMVRLTGPGEHAVEVTLASVFVKRQGPSNKTLARAMMPGPDAPPADVRTARHRARARAALAAARADTSPPLGTARVVAAVDFNGVGFCYFANFIRFFTLAEIACLQPSAWALGVVAREAHWFGNCDDGERLELRCTSVAPRTETGLGLATFASVRRASDGMVIAVCETLRAAPAG
jgi:probable biosynthetic protein (TIGR04098 family)